MKVEAKKNAMFSRLLLSLLALLMSFTFLLSACDVNEGNDDDNGVGIGEGVDNDGEDGDDDD